MTDKPISQLPVGPKRAALYKELDLLTVRSVISFPEIIWILMIWWRLKIFLLGNGYFQSGREAN